MKWLKFYREKVRLSQKSLAEKVGVQENTVWRWENERAVPSAEMGMSSKLCMYGVYATFGNLSPYFT